MIAVEPAPSNAQATASHAVGPSSTPEWCARLPRPEYAHLERVATPSAWFEVYRVDPGVYALYEPHQWQEVISWLIVGTRQALLFDTGMGLQNIQAVASSITALPIQVLNSHTHHDHVGDDWRFDNVLGMDDPFTKRNAAGVAHAGVADEVAPKSLCGVQPASLDTAGYRVRAFRITSVVHDGSRIDLGGRTLEVLHVPGHAPDAIALLDRANGLIFTGDTFYEGPIYVFGKGSDRVAFTRSAERLAALAPSLRKVLASHNVAVSDPEMLVKLRDAARAVTNGTVAGKRDGGLVTYAFDRFSLVLPPD